MTGDGMKPGAGADPYADMEENTTSSEDDSVQTTETGNEGDESTSENDTSPRRDTSQTTAPSPDIPYTYARNSVKDRREQYPLHRQPETNEQVETLVEKFRAEFPNDRTYRTDVVEALVRAGLNHEDEVEAQLEEWGYGLDIDLE
jgi:hypothetical protein